MVDWVALNSILSARNGVWTLVVLFVVGLWRGWAGLPAVMAQWVAMRQAQAAEKRAVEAAKEAAKAADWSRIRDEVDRLAGRVRLLEEQVAECERDRLHWMDRAIKAEAVLMGQGETRQQAQRIVAVERLTDKRKKEQGE